MRMLIGGLTALMLVALLVPAGAVAKDKVEIDPYGFVRAEAYYNTGKAVQGDWLLFALPEENPAFNKGEFSMDARHSRVGIKLHGISLGTDADASARIEADFAGGFPSSTTAARQPQLRLRLAYIDILSGQWSFRFGQDWVLLSMPVPNTAMFVVGAGMGNLWMRMPQFRISYHGTPVTLSASVNRPIAGNQKYNSVAGSDLDVIGDGERTGLPFLMGRIDVKGRIFSISFFGHTGWEDIDDLSGTVHRMVSWSANAAAQMETEKIRIRFKGFQGENLNSFFGGVLQGFVLYPGRVENVSALGGWLDFTVHLDDKWDAALGAGMDDPDDADLVAGMRDFNTWVFGNVSYSPVDRVTFTFETNYLNTDYYTDETGENIRFQLNSVFTF